MAGGRDAEGARRAAECIEGVEEVVGISRDSGENGGLVVARNERGDELVELRVLVCTDLEFGGAHAHSNALLLVLARQVRYNAVQGNDLLAVRSPQPVASWALRKRVVR